MTQTLEREGVTFVCDDPLEVWRANTITEKEPGTIAWIQTFQPGDVFYDIGANIGVYTLLAAKQVGPNGMVFACEPHLPNACALLQNVAANRLQQQVFVVTMPLSDSETWRPFQYRSLKRGSSGSQLGASQVGGHTFQPVVTEWKLSASIASLPCHPTHIKIDVDGHETSIVEGIGADKLARVLSVQVETEPQHRTWLIEFFRDAGFDVSDVHYTSNGQHAIEQGADPANVIANTIFRRKAA